MFKSSYLIPARQQEVASFSSVKDADLLLRHNPYPPLVPPCPSPLSQLHPYLYLHATQNARCVCVCVCVLPRRVKLVLTVKTVKKTFTGHIIRDVCTDPQQKHTFCHEFNSALLIALSVCLSFAQELDLRWIWRRGWCRTR